MEPCPNCWWSFTSPWGCYRQLVPAESNQQPNVQLQTPVGGRVSIERGSSVVMLQMGAKNQVPFSPSSEKRARGTVMRGVPLCAPSKERPVRESDAVLEASKDDVENARQK
ncbi:hypothetical protein ZHAS_00009866 [Anopheles sinensis]|uniref:Uncharacterized protein n=1 Tax=Anopheles sinensis TaxID=74873 RepID=A0A084VW51_ANOSI|nr:hypothetical protein ZHAS_00009866 [Anopheles sinensis]